MMDSNAEYAKVVLYHLPSSNLLSLVIVREKEKVAQDISEKNFECIVLLTQLSNTNCQI